MWKRPNTRGKDTIGFLISRQFVELVGDLLEIKEDRWEREADPDLYLWDACVGGVNDLALWFSLHRTR